jgi:hypothetical protein
VDQPKPKLAWPSLGRRLEELSERERSAYFQAVHESTPSTPNIRSPLLAPPSERATYTYIRPEWQDVAEAARMVEALVERRRALLRQHRSLPAAPAASLSGGRTLACTPDENISDGTSAHASRAFFDDWDEPPWDLWLWYEDRRLLSWVPGAYLEDVEYGIEVNAVADLAWATDVEDLLAAAP